MTPRKTGTGTVTIVGVGCCWKSCEEKCMFPDGTTSMNPLPEGWYQLTISKESPFKEGGYHNIEGGYLCPKHYEELLGYLQDGAKVSKAVRKRQRREQQCA